MKFIKSKGVHMFNSELGTSNVVIAGNVVDTDAGSIDFGFIDYIGKIPGLIHHLVDCSANENTFTLENRSKWIASNIDMVRNWKADDELLITQNQALFSAYRFALVNPRLQKAVPISLLREPLPVDHKMFFLFNIDPSNDVVALSNGVEYTVYSHDHGTLKKFSENDRIILGFNSSDKLDSTNLDYYKCYLLINTTCNSYVRANPTR
jgi:hypothetical protein